jgi:hypothetical protein
MAPLTFKLRCSISKSRLSGSIFFAENPQLQKACRRAPFQSWNGHPWQAGDKMKEVKMPLCHYGNLILTA